MLTPRDMPILVAFFAVLLAASLHQGDFAWFQPTRYREYYVARWERFPAWWPLKGLFLVWVGSRAYLFFSRVMFLLGAALSAAGLVFLL